MKFYSTKGQVSPVDFKTAVIQGLPQDNGLYFPDEMPNISKEQFNSLKTTSIQEFATELAFPFVKKNLNRNQLEKIVNRTLSFDIPLVKLSDRLSILELFHGPTLAFKDVGARFLAGCLSEFASQNDESLNILVATSGDTGSAVANAFLGLDGVNVFVLYPKGKVSNLQKQQMTTLGQNITALEIEGNFDDCQKLVKTAFLDDELNQNMKLTSANSINIARLLPQSFYYHWAFQQLEDWEDVAMIVPSGNLGNICAGIFAHAMGLPIAHFVASHNANDAFPQFLESGNYDPKPSVKTISNAMDVGDPSNFVRIQEIKKAFGGKVTASLNGYSFTDAQTNAAMQEGRDYYNYTFDPHGAVGYLAYREMRNKQSIILETAHPAKFNTVVEQALGEDVAIPDSLQVALGKESTAISMENSFEAFKELLLSSN